MENQGPVRRSSGGLWAALVAAIGVVWCAAGSSPLEARTTKTEESQAIPIVKECMARLGMLDRSINVTLETYIMPKTALMGRKVWTVECSDSNGRYIGFLSIDATAGEVVTAVRNRREHPSKENKTMSRDQAIARAGSIVRQCTPTRAFESVRLSGEPELGDDLWIVTLSSRSRVASVSLDRRTGALAAFTQRRLKSSTKVASAS
jgi:hypothetical protein